MSWLACLCFAAVGFMAGLTLGRMDATPPTDLLFRFIGRAPQSVRDVVFQEMRRQLDGNTRDQVH